MPVQNKYRVIFHFHSKYPVIVMCRFFNVSRSGYYDWVQRMNRKDKDTDLMELVLEGYHKSKETYGYRRIKIWLCREYSKVVNTKTVLRIMRKLNISSVIRRRRIYKNYTEAIYKYPNILNRDFSADKPNQKWATDITYIKTKQGFLYLSAIKDLYDGYIISYRTSRDFSIGLVNGTIKEAKEKEMVTDGLTLHSDPYHYPQVG